jgi:hypothetical protein
MSQLHIDSYLTISIVKYSNHTASSSLSIVPVVVVVVVVVRELGYLSRYSDRLLAG